MTDKAPRSRQEPRVSANEDQPAAAVRRLVAILIADVAGYTRLMERDDTGTLARLRRIRQTLVDPALRRHGGRVVKTGGDSMLVEFGSADAALRCAIEVQQGMRELNRDIPPDDRLEFRIGINVGDIIVDGDEIAGDGINVAARLEALSSPGAICISGAVHEQVHGDFGARFDDIGDQQVRNLLRPIRVFRVTIGGDPPLTVAQPRQPRVRAWPRVAAWTGLAAAIALIASSVWLWPRLSTWFAADAAIAQPALSVAILPFAPSSPSAEDRRYADDLTQDLTTGLGAWHRATVTAYAMAADRRAKGGDIQALGQELHVRYAIEGDVRRDGQGIVVSARMIDTSTGRQVWSDRLRYDSLEPAAGKPVARLQLTKRLRIALEETEVRRLATQPVAGSALEMVLRGQAMESNAAGREDVLKARALYTEALKLDPNSVPALDALAESYDDELEDNWSIDRVAAKRELERLTSRAIALDPNEARAWVMRASSLQWQGRWGEALSATERAHALDPSERGALLLHAWSLIRTARPLDALAVIEQARAIDPLENGNPDHFACKAYLFLGRYTEAVAACERAAAVVHGWVNQLYLCTAYAMNGETAKAAVTRAELLKEKPGYTVARYREMYASSPPAFFDLVDQHLAPGLRKAGIPER